VIEFVERPIEADEFSGIDEARFIFPIALGPPEAAAEKPDTVLVVDEDLDKELTGGN
jgi:hypothetical protein